MHDTCTHSGRCRSARIVVFVGAVHRQQLGGLARYAHDIGSVINLYAIVAVGEAACQWMNCDLLAVPCANAAGYFFNSY